MMSNKLIVHTLLKILKENMFFVPEMKSLDQENTQEAKLYTKKKKFY